MATCDQCGVEVHTMEVLAVETRDGLRYACSDDCKAKLLHPEPVELPPLEEAERPAAKKRGRPAGSKNKPKPPIATDEVAEEE